MNKPVPANPRAPEPLDWLDTPEFRPWFADWLLRGWDGLRHAAPLPRRPSSRVQRLKKIEQAGKRLARSLPALHPANQLRRVAAAAGKCGLIFNADAALDHLHFDLVHTGPKRPSGAGGRDWRLRRKAYRASPWYAERAQHQRRVEQLGFKVCRKHYPDSPDCQFALRRVMAEFYAVEVSHRHRRGHAVWEPGLFAAVRECCQQPDGARKLAECIVAMLRPEPHCAAPTPENMEAIARAVRRNGDLRRALRLLARDAAHRKRKGWVHLRSALRAALDYITREPRLRQKLYDFYLNHHPALQNRSRLRPGRLACFKTAHPEHAGLDTYDKATSHLDTRAAKAVRETIERG